MSNKLALLVLCGGVSTEHSISLQSAHNVVAALDKAVYDVAVVYISQQGRWFYISASDFLQYGKDAPAIEVTWRFGSSTATLMAVDNPNQTFVIDCVFPVLHGTNGEDGSIQGLLQLLNVAYVGADVLASAMCMDKDVTKQLLQAQGIRVVPWQLVDAKTPQQGLFQRISASLGADLFVKPARLGSSVGISRAGNEKDFLRALNHALKYDARILVEQCIIGREIECAVMGNDTPDAALPGEIILLHGTGGFYSYNAKYLDAQVATTAVPADLTPKQTAQIQQIAVQVFGHLRCCGMLRVDFFLGADGVIYVNEVNTIPGFTQISLYPKMWQASGLSYSETLERLIHFALARHRDDQALERVYAAKVK